jgi:hypothetical protein
MPIADGISEEEVDYAIAAFGYSRVACTTEGRAVSPNDLRTDMSAALKAFMQYITSEGVP